MLWFLTNAGAPDGKPDADRSAPVTSSVAPRTRKL